MRLAIIIPARYGSTRFEGKPLAPLLGKPMIRHVYERAAMARLSDSVVVATDDERIACSVKGFGGTVVITSGSHQTGTDRIAEVAAGLDVEWIINLQGDEPLIQPEVIDLLARSMMGAPHEHMFSLMRPVCTVDEYMNPHAVKVVTDHQGYALYFSRAPIPCPKGGWSHLQGVSEDHPAVKNAHIHCGIYGYRKDFLLTIPSMRPSALECTEGLEQLRILSNGHRIVMIRTEYRAIGVDTPEDIAVVEELLRREKRSLMPGAG
ncbi:MAG: 3-deoxy-manno-octulosonate cytidylyltransferase [bacterium]